LTTAIRSIGQTGSAGSLSRWLTTVMPADAGPSRTHPPGLGDDIQLDAQMRRRRAIRGRATLMPQSAPKAWAAATV
jgi:hypothetical protein